MTLQLQCPICATTCEWEGNHWRPFCSERCKLIDLGAWIDEDYTIAHEPVAIEQDIDNEIG